MSPGTDRERPGSWDRRDGEGRPRVPRRLERVITDLAALENDAMVVMARLDRIDATAQSLDEVRAMHSRRERLAKRVERLEDGPSPMHGGIYSSIPIVDDQSGSTLIHLDPTRGHG